MWQLKNPETKPSTLDFGSSGQGEFHVHQLLCEGVELINAIEWNSEDLQFLLCEACGCTHCKPGDWVGVRKSDSLVLILPASKYIRREKEERAEYGPPFYLKQRGIAYLDLLTYERLRTNHSCLPSTDKIQPLKLKEAALLFHWNAPDRILGDPPSISLPPEVVVGSSEGNYVELLEELSTLLQAQYEIESPAQLRPLSTSERIVSFYVDAAEFKEWDAMVWDGSKYRLLVDSSYVID